MVQLFLDPKVASSNTASNVWIPDGPIPPRLRDFGYCADFNVLLPGDLILVSATSPNLIETAIRKIQKIGGYGENDARWEHAAVYVEDDTICEATRSGVQIASLFDYIGTHTIRVRRNPGLSTNERWSLAVKAIQQRGESYGFNSIINLFLKAFVGYWNRDDNEQFSFPKRAVYCSELYAKAHIRACGVALGNLKSGEITPASLSLDPLLVDVNVGWVKIA